MNLSASSTFWPFMVAVRPARGLLLVFYVSHGSKHVFKLAALDRRTDGRTQASFNAFTSVPGGHNKLIML